MQPWVYALIFISALLAFGVVVDWRARRVRRSLERYGGGPAGPGVNAGTIERTAPGTTTQPHGHHGHHGHTG